MADSRQAGPIGYAKDDVGTPGPAGSGGDGPTDTLEPYRQRVIDTGHSLTEIQKVMQKKLYKAMREEFLEQTSHWGEFLSTSKLQKAQNKTMPQSAPKQFDAFLFGTFDPDKCYSLLDSKLRLAHDLRLEEFLGAVEEYCKARSRLRPNQPDHQFGSKANLSDFWDWGQMLSNGIAVTQAIGDDHQASTYILQTVIRLARHGADDSYSMFEKAFLDWKKQPDSEKLQDVLIENTILLSISLNQLKYLSPGTEEYYKKKVAALTRVKDVDKDLFKHPGTDRWMDRLR